jgi:hypothetical protein
MWHIHIIPPFDLDPVKTIFPAFDHFYNDSQITVPLVRLPLEGEGEGGARMFQRKEEKEQNSFELLQQVLLPSAAAAAAGRTSSFCWR